MAWLRRTRNTINTRLREQVLNEFRACRSVANPSGAEFIHPADAERIMTCERIKGLFESFDWYRQSDRAHFYVQMRLIFCILLWDKFTQWIDFGELFFIGEGRSVRVKFMDEDLPLEEEAAKLALLPLQLRISFGLAQHVFKPVIFKKDRHLEYSRVRRLPIIAVHQEFTNQGGQGEVDKITIEVNYMQDGPDSANIVPKVMARKTIKTNTAEGNRDSITEQSNLRQFKECLSKNRNIMLSFNSFTHGSDIVFLFDWADGGDLNTFLYKGSEIYPDYAQRSVRYTPHHLMEEALRLAHGIKALHQDLITHGGQPLVCAHSDLKPENVLVCFDPYTKLADQPVGIWKITDFGLAKIEEVVSGNQVIPVEPPDGPNVPKTIADVIEISTGPRRRGPGPFQPPEVQSSETAKVSTGRDVWSFGCILAMVLAFAVGGEKEVKKQQASRKEGLHERFYRSRKLSEIVANEDGSPIDDAEIKPDFIRWLRNVPHQRVPQPNDWVDASIKLILDLLTINVVKRPAITHATENLWMITVYTAEQGTRRIWDLNNLPEAGSEFEHTLRPGIQIEISTPAPNLTLRPPHVNLYRDPVVRTTSVPSLPASENTTRSQGTRSSHINSLDPVSGHCQLQSPPSCEGVSLSTSGQVALLWSKASLVIYNLRSLSDNGLEWASKLPKSPSIFPQKRTATLPTGSSCIVAKASGSYVAALERTGQDCYNFRICKLSWNVLANNSQHDTKLDFSRMTTFPLKERPADLKVSCLGDWAIRYSFGLEVSLNHRMMSIPLQDTQLASFEFSSDGTCFCIWELDTAVDKRNSYHWSAWKRDYTLWGGETMSYPRAKSISLPTTSIPNQLLLPFNQNPCFIAIDNMTSEVFLLRANELGKRVQYLVRTNPVFAGCTLPLDDGFVLIKQFSDNPQTVEKLTLFSLRDNVSFNQSSYGKLTQQLKANRFAITSRSEDPEPYRTCLLMLSTSGQLTRQYLL